METITIRGKQTSAVVYADELDDLCKAQIRNVCNHPAFSGSRVRIMPDVHAGAGCVIGFTATMVNDCVIPNLIGVDIGCGVLTTKIRDSVVLDEESLAALDHEVRTRVPHGFDVRKKPLPYLPEVCPELLEEIARITKDLLKDDVNRHYKSLGTLGGGNHFIEISRDAESGSHYLHVHSGSRNFGHGIAEAYQKLAQNTCEADVPAALKYLSGELAKRYIREMKVAQQFAAINRQMIVRNILGVGEMESFDTIHNYISEDGYMRKGSVSAHEGELLLIPLNMRDGSLLCRGKGKEEYNYSSPHGAGRLYSRTQAKAKLSLEEFEASMNGIFTTSVSAATLDESPMAYKPVDSILKFIEPTAEVISTLKPVYNFKAP